MIGPVDALALPHARLTSSQRARATEHAERLDRHVRDRMRYRGCEFDLEEQDPDVIAAVGREIARAGWHTRIEMMLEPARVRGGQPRLVGVRISLMPPPEAYAETERTLAPAEAKGLLAPS